MRGRLQRGSKPLSFPQRREYRNEITKSYYVYILASKRNSTLYIGVTNDIIRRLYEHKHNLVSGFTSRYGVHRLVYDEEAQDVKVALKQEKQLKKWDRVWKLKLIEEANHNWTDLSQDWIPDQVGNDR